MAMDDHLKQRIVGAIVLVTLGVIFIPAILDGSGYRSRQIQDIEIKDKPDFPPLSQKALKPIPTPLDERREAKQLAESKKTDKPDGNLPSKENKSASKSKAMQSFALQVGTFESEANAIKLRDKLRKGGYTTYVQFAEGSKSKGKSASYKVRIGPNLQRSQLEKSLKEVEKKYSLEGYIVNHP